MRGYEYDETASLDVRAKQAADGMKEHLKTVYHNEWTTEQIDELRKQARLANERAEKIKKEWELEEVN